MSAFHHKCRVSRNLWQGRPALPRLWLFTDERVASGILLSSIERLPRGSGVVFRHYATPSNEREALLLRVQRLARRRGIALLLGGERECFRPWRADGRHMSGRYLADQGGARHVKRRGLLSVSVHNAREMAAAKRHGADLVFLSPVYPTRSHADARTLGKDGFARLARFSHAPVIALGGMTAERFTGLRALGAYGWAGIDGLTGK